MLAKFLPRYNEIAGGISDNLVSGLAGQLPSGVQNAFERFTQRQAATKAVYGGFSNSGMKRNLEARDLALGAYEVTNRTMDAATRWVSATTGALEPLMFRPSSFAINPVDSARFAQQERDAEFQRDYVKNQWDWYGSFGQQLVRFENTAVQLASSVGGAAMACWVARAVFGQDNPKWILFREWLFTRAPGWFVSLYLTHGERFAQWIADKPRIKNIIRVWMEKRIKTLEVSHFFV